MVHFELGKQAKTIFQLMEYDAETDQSRVRLEPVTGRSINSRVHMMHIGHPIMEINSTIQNPNVSFKTWLYMRHIWHSSIH